MRRSGITTLPGEATSFIGRRDVLTAIRSRIGSGARLVTLVGIGGIGKSRVVVQAARQLTPVFPDGVIYVDLTQLRHRELLAQAVLDAAGIPPAASEEAAEYLIRSLAGKAVLIVLDNCEHLLAACAELVALLLRRTAGVAVLSTSRMPLGTTGEWLIPVQPLAVSGQDADGVALFVDRVQSVQSAFVVDAANIGRIEALCARLDGLPLAIELAARRMRVLSLDQLIDRLEDRFRILTEAPNDVPERHRSLRAVFDYSYEQCSPDESRLWAQASVFVGSISLEALEAVCVPDGPVTALDLVDGLVQRSILIRSESVNGARYRMLESIREYGIDRLHDELDTVQLRHRHRGYFSEVARRAERHWFGPRQADWSEELRLELPNLRAALDSFLSDGEWEAAAEMVADLWPFWLAHGHLHEGRMWFQRSRVDDYPSPKTMWVSAWIDLLEGDVETSTRRLKISVALSQKLGDIRSLANATALQGAVALVKGDLETGASLYERSLEINATTDDPAGRAFIYLQLGEIYCAAGRPDDALVCAQKSRELSEPLGEQACSSYAMWVQALAMHISGDNSAAEAMASTAMLTKYRLHDRLGMMLLAELLAWIAVDNGEFDRGAVLLGATSEIWVSVSSQLMGLGSLITLRDQAMATLRGALDAPVLDTAWQRGTGMAEDDMIKTAIRGAGSPGAGTEDVPSPNTPVSPLTKREIEVARLIAEGLSNRELARRLVIGQRTVETHVTNILTKAGLDRRGQVAKWLADQGVRSESV